MTRMGDEGSSDVPFWEQPEWWAVRGDAAVSRRGLIRRWADRADLAGLDRSRFEDALNAWSSKLAAQEWVRAALGATAVMYASKGINSTFAGSDDWQRVSTMFGDFGDPLARYVVTFIPEVHRYRPAVEKWHRSAVREAARSVTKDVRDAMISDGVIASRESVNRFLADPARRRRRDLQVAAGAYAANLCTHANRLDDPDLTQAVTVSLIGLRRELGIPVPAVAGTRAETARDCSLEAREIFWGSLSGREGNSDEFFDESARRAIAAIENKLTQGGDVTPQYARAIYYTKKKSIAVEQIRPRSITTTPMESELLEIRVGAAPQTTDREAEQAAVLAAAVSFLKDVPIVRRRSSGSEPVPVTTFWEKDIAMAILAGRTDLGTRLSRISAVVGEKWESEGGKPATALCTTGKHAAGFVRGLVYVGLANAIGALDELPEWLGRATPTQTWAERRQTVSAMLERYRELGPQDLYDNPAKGNLT